jgi:hypothetical protein
MLEAGRDPTLAGEPLPEPWVSGERRRDHLERDLPPECEVLSSVHDAHAAPAGDGADLVAADDVTGHELCGTKDEIRGRNACLDSIACSRIVVDEHRSARQESARDIAVSPCEGAVACSLEMLGGTCGEVVVLLRSEF